MSAKARCQKIASWLAFSSGMGAICTMMWTLLRPGDEILVDLTLYGCTHSLVSHLLPAFGIVTRVADFTNLDEVREQLSGRTRLVLFETSANPNMRLVDIAAVSAVVRQHSTALVAVDNTYGTPYLQRPLQLGAHIVTHSLTKYLNGHGDVIAGALIGSRELLTQLRFVGIKELTGACMSPMDAYLVLRGLKTLATRMDRHCQSAQTIAEFLEARPEVASVSFPSLASFPQYELAKRQMTKPGGMIAFELTGDIQTGKRFINALKMVTRAVSLGDAESLAQHPASMTHSPYSPEEREKHLISDGLVRLSVRLEEVLDIVADLQQALEAAVGVSRVGMV
jgi:methionine-gamma-lyase